MTGSLGSTIGPIGPGRQKAMAVESVPPGRASHPAAPAGSPVQCWDLMRKQFSSQALPSALELETEVKSRCDFHREDGGAEGWV